MVGPLLGQPVDALGDLLLCLGHLVGVLALGPLVDGRTGLVEDVADLVAVLVGQLGCPVLGLVRRLGCGVGELVGLALQVELLGPALQPVHEGHDDLRPEVVSPRSTPRPGEQFPLGDRRGRVLAALAAQQGRHR